MNGMCNGKSRPRLKFPGEGSKGQILFNLNYKVNFKDLYTKRCVCSHK